MKELPGIIDSFCKKWYNTLIFLKKKMDYESKFSYIFM